MHDTKFLGFSSHKIEHARTTFLGYATIIVPEDAVGEGIVNGDGARRFDDGSWILVCPVRQSKSTGALLVDFPTSRGLDGMWHPSIKMEKETRCQIRELVESHLPEQGE